MALCDKMVIGYGRYCFLILKLKMKTVYLYHLRNMTAHKSNAINCAYANFSILGSLKNKNIDSLV